MTTFESQIKTIYAPDQLVFTSLSSFKNFDTIAAEKIKGWESTEDTCRFKVDKLGEFGLRIVERDPYKTIKIESEGKAPFTFTFWMQLKQMSYNDTRMKLTIKADLNMMMKMFAQKPLENFINTLADEIANSFNRMYAQTN